MWWGNIECNYKRPPHSVELIWIQSTHQKTMLYCIFCILYPFISLQFILPSGQFLYAPFHKKHLKMFYHLHFAIFSMFVTLCVFLVYRHMHLDRTTLVVQFIPKSFHIGEYSESGGVKKPTTERRRRRGSFSTSNICWVRK